VPYLEQEDFILRWYEIDPETGRFKYQRGLLGRPRGWGKSPILAAIACAEALAPVVPCGWNAAGQPVGKPWSTLYTPLVHISAVSEKQTRNTWQPLLEMLRDGPAIDEFPGLDPLDTMVFLPKGKIEQVTAEARTIKGAPIVFGTLDQTEEWVPSNKGPVLAQTIRTNAAKNGGRTLESPNAFIPGQDSVAEMSAAYAADIREGRAKNPGLLYDHREAPADTDMSDYDSLLAGLRVAYGDSSGHADGCVIHTPPCPPGHEELESLIGMVWDPASDVQQLRADLLNQITHASDSWVTSPEWGACTAVDKIVADKDVIVLGFDGSRGRTKGRADATALIGCRVSDGHLFEIGQRSIWEEPRDNTRRIVGADGRKHKKSEWLPPVAEIDAAVRWAFQRYTVVGFYADPSGWNEYVAKWEAAFGARLKVKATQLRPIAAWPRGKAASAVEAVDVLHKAITNGACSHDGSSALTRHALNARKRPVRTGYLLYKSYPDSPDKIDAAYAAVMAWKARLDAVSKGLGRRTTRKIQRIR
jgi:hypothetical protein